MEKGFQRQFNVTLNARYLRKKLKTKRYCMPVKNVQRAQTLYIYYSK